MCAYILLHTSQEVLSRDQLEILQSNQQTPPFVFEFNKLIYSIDPAYVPSLDVTGCDVCV